MVEVDQLVLDTAYAFSHYFSHILLKLLQIQGKAWVCLAEVLQHVLEGQLIALAKLAVLLGILLDSVVGEVDKFIVDVSFFISLRILFIFLNFLFLILFLFFSSHYIFYTSQSDVALLEQVSFQYFFALYLYHLQHHPETHVKFVAINQQWSINVLLYNVSHRFGIVTIHFDTYLKGCLAEQFRELFESGKEVYASASVQIGRFKYP